MREGEGGEGREKEGKKGLAYPALCPEGVECWLPVGRQRGLCRLLQVHKLHPITSITKCWGRIFPGGREGGEKWGEREGGRGRCSGSYFDKLVN